MTRDSMVIWKHSAWAVVAELQDLSIIHNLRNSTIQSKEIISILRKWQRRSFSVHNDFS